MDKISWHDYYLAIAKLVSSRSTCLSPAKGAVLVYDRGIISTGYNGAPKGIDDCKYQIGYCRKRKLGYKSGEGNSECLAVHAEANAIVFAAKRGIQIKGSTMYCTHKPCNACAQLIINSEIKEVYYLEDYPNSTADALFESVEIALIKREPIDIELLFK